MAIETVPPAPLSLEQMARLLERALETSVADETEIVWIEGQRGRVEARGDQAEGRGLPERLLMVRVIDRGRVGSYRSATIEVGELEDAVRQALGQSRGRQPLPGLPHLPADESEAILPAGSRDPAIARLAPEEAAGLFRGRLEPRESAVLTWFDARVAVFNSRGVRRRAAVTAVELAVKSGRGAGQGRSSGAARTLADLDAEGVLETARRRRARGAPTEVPAGPLPIVLSPQATGALVEMMNRLAFTAQAYHDGVSFLRDHLGVQVFDRALTLTDDGTEPAGLPFPFDLEGTATRPVDLVAAGTPKTPALDQRQAAVLGLPPTAHAVGGADARAEHLFLVPGEASEEDLLAAADGGLWIGGLEAIECYEPRRLRFRARAAGVRRIEDGRLGKGVVDLTWDDSLLRALSEITAIGRDPVRLPGPDGFTGATTTPALALPPGDGLFTAR